MRKVSISDVKNGLSALIDSLKGKSSVLIFDQGRPVARLEGVIGNPEGEQDGRLARLVPDGLVRPRRTKPSWAMLNTKPPRALAGASVIDILIEERREGR